MFEDPHKLVEACVRGDEQAWAAFEEMFRSTVSRVVRSVLPKEQCGIGPDDGVQESFVRILEVLHRWNGGNLHAFVATIARFKTIDILRGIKNETEELRHSTKVGPETTRSGENDDSHQVALLNECAELVRNALHPLDPRYRTVVEMRICDDLKFPEIGKRLGIPESTARVRYGSALRKLAHEIQKLE